MQKWHIWRESEWHSWRKSKTSRKDDTNTLYTQSILALVSKRWEWQCQLSCIWRWQWHCSWRRRSQCQMLVRNLQSCDPLLSMMSALDAKQDRMWQTKAAVLLCVSIWNSSGTQNILRMQIGNNKLCRKTQKVLMNKPISARRQITEL